MCVSSILEAVGEGPNLPWFQVVSCGRVGPALRPILTLSLLRPNRVAELLAASCALIFRLEVLRSVKSETSEIVRRSTYCWP